jgi:hypothetical protein
MKIDEGAPIQGDLQNLCIKEDFQEFRLSGFDAYLSAIKASTPKVATSGGHTGGSAPYTPRAHYRLSKFKKGIKHDPASFTVLKDNKQWDSVHQTLKAQTSYQDVDDVLNPNYLPKSAEETELFNKKQKYMYSVFKRILQTDEGKVIVRSHDPDCNAQKIYKLLCDKSQTVIHRSNIHSASNPADPNLRLDPLDGENLPQSARIVKSVQDTSEDVSDPVEPMIYFDIGDFVGRTFLMEEDNNGPRCHACIIEVLEDQEKNVADNPVLKKFKCLVGEDEFEEILSYNKVMQHLEQDDDDGETFWKYHPTWKGDKYNVKVEWENGEVSYEPLHTITADDHVTCAIYAKYHGLLDTDGWKRSRSLAKRAKKMLCMVNQSKLRSYKTCKKYMYGIEIPRGYEDAIILDKLHGNNKWQSTTKSWSWVNFVNTTPSMTKVSGQLLGRRVQEDSSSSCVCMQAQ